MSLFRNLFSLATRAWIYPPPNTDDEDLAPVPDEETQCNDYSAEPYRPSQHLDAETLQELEEQSSSDDSPGSSGADGSLYSVFTGQQDMGDEVVLHDPPTFVNSSSRPQSIASDQAPVPLPVDQAQPRVYLPPDIDDEPQAALANHDFHSPPNQSLPANSANKRRGRGTQHSGQQRESSTRAGAFPLIDLVGEDNEPISRREARRRRAQERKAVQNGTSSQPRPQADEPEQDPQPTASTSQNGPHVERISPEERAIRIYMARYGVASLANPASSSTTHPRPRRSRPTPSAPSSSAHVHTPIADPVLSISERYYQIGRAAGPSGLMPAFNNPFHSPGNRHNDMAQEGLTRSLQSQTQIYRHIPFSHPVSNTPTTPQGRWQLGPPSRSEEFNYNNSPCLICLDIPKNFPRFRPTSRCTHKSTICASCLEQHISYAVRTRGLTTLTCPDTGCRQVMEYADVLRGAKNDRACLDRYETLLLRRTLEKEPNFVWCKNPTCNWGQVHEGGAAAPIIVCQVCRTRSCFTHDVPWHSGLTCEQYTIARRAEVEREDHASQTYIEQHAKRCPGPFCGRLIEKTDGCDHMTCLPPVGCGHEFCWLCLADYEPIRREGNHRHRDTCPHHAPSRSITPAFIIAPDPFEGEVEVAQLVEAERLERLMHWEHRFRHVYDDDDPDPF